jgi:hypothetical protein
MFLETIDYNNQAKRERGKKGGRSRKRENEK